MKRLLVGVGIVVGMFGVSFASRVGMYGDYGGYSTHVSTVVANNTSNMPISSGSIVLVDYHVLSTGTKSGVTFQQCANPTGNLNGWIPFGSTYPVNSGSAISGIVTYPTDYLVTGSGMELVLKSTAGWCMNKYGESLSVIDLNWDFWR